VLQPVISKTIQRPRSRDEELPRGALHDVPRSCVSAFTAFLRKYPKIACPNAQIACKAAMVVASAWPKDRMCPQPKCIF
jgi:hypothetical protein